MEKTHEEQLIELEKEMKKLNLDFLPKSSIDLKKKFLVVEVDIDCEVKIDFMKDIVMTKKVLRGSTYIVSFEVIRPGTLTMKIGVELPKDFENVYRTADFAMLGVIATTFPDLCWIHSEGTTNSTIQEVETKLREGAVVGDLTWVLPSKFVDDFVEMMHTLNHGIISGLMQDAVMYGPFIFETDEVYR